MSDEERAAVLVRAYPPRAIGPYEQMWNERREDVPGKKGAGLSVRDRYLRYRGQPSTHVELNSSRGLQIIAVVK